MGMDRRQREALDNYITGHYGEDQFKGPDPEEEENQTNEKDYSLVDEEDGEEDDNEEEFEDLDDEILDDEDEIV